MTFRATSIVPQEAYRIVKGAAVQLKLNLQSMNSYLAANGADYDYLRNIYRTLERADAQFDNLKSTPGILQYAKDQEAEPAYDISAEFTTMQAAISDALTWMDGNVPTNVTAKAPADWGDGSLISNTFTPAQTSGLQTELAAVIATIS